MKIFQTEITAATESDILFIEKKELFDLASHSRDELQLVFITQGSGKSFIKNSITDFSKTDVITIGRNFSQSWNEEKNFNKIASAGKASAIVFYFNKNIFNEEFYATNELSSLRKLFQNAEKGLVINGKTKLVVGEKLKELLQKQDLQKIIGMLQILQILAESNEVSFISGDKLNRQFQTSKTDRLSGVYKYVNENFKENIDLQTIATISNLTPQSFCRLFKKRTNKSFIQYLNEVRIAAACDFLLNTDWSISEIAYNCGYKTISNFNKLFKSNTSSSPKIYRNQRQKNSQPFAG